MTSNAKILVTDDSQVARKFITRLLRTLPYSIEYAKNGKEALAKIAEGDYNLMLLDLLMPDMDGVDVLKYLKENSFDIPVIVISADIQLSTKELCMEYGAKEFLNKPPETEELFNAIEKHLK